jgi:hypothetical protein
MVFERSFDGPMLPRARGDTEAAGVAASPAVQVGAPVARRLANMRENPPEAK